MSTKIDQQKPLTQLDNLYTYLITNRKHELYGWHVGYSSLTSQVEKIRKNLMEGNSLELKDKDAYKDTDWENDANFFESFMEKLITDKSNGVSSRGQSIVSNENFQNVKDLFLNDPSFVDAVKVIIQEPNSNSFEKLNSEWNSQKEKKTNVKMNHVLINRIVAASTLSVSSTVDNKKFDEVYHHLKKHGLITGSDNTSWFGKNQHLMEELKNGLSHYDNGQANKDDDIWLSIFVWELYNFISKPFNLQKQVIRYGAPGTGKTYTAIQDSRLQFDIWRAGFNKNYGGDRESHIETVQFHPSFGYEDFIEGLRPVPADEGTELKLVNGIFKEFCKRAAKWELELYDKIGKKEIPWSSFTVKDFLNEENFKDLLNDERWSYLSNVIEPENKFLADALPPFFFIIDEINRAELSRVMGELMFCLENRGLNGAIKTQYAQLNNADEGIINFGANGKSDYRFFVPVNLYIIGTMNTIDRSVESFDFALRRRFFWERREPDYAVIKYHYTLVCRSCWNELADNLKSLNEAISRHEFLSEDHQIGHAYLMNLPYRKDTSISELRRQVWSSRIAPLLDEYLRGTGSDSTKFKAHFGI